MDDPNDNTLTDLERFKGDPKLFQLARRIRKVSKRQAQLERNWRNFVKQEVPTLAKTTATKALRAEMDQLKRDYRSLQGKFLGAVGAIALMIVKWLLDQIHK